MIDIIRLLVGVALMVLMNIAMANRPVHHENAFMMVK